MIFNINSTRGHTGSLLVLTKSRGSKSGRMGQTSRCFIVCSSPHLHVVCPSSLNPHLCIGDLHHPVPVRKRFRLDQAGHASLDPLGSDSVGPEGELVCCCLEMAGPEGQVVSDFCW